MLLLPILTPVLNIIVLYFVLRLLCYSFFKKPPRHLQANQNPAYAYAVPEYDDAFLFRDTDV